MSMLIIERELFFNVTVSLHSWQINYNPTVIDVDREVVMGVRGSLEVDILVMPNIITPELDKLEV